MSSSPLTALSPGVDPALRAAVLSELDAAGERLDEAASVLTALRDACSWESEGVEALRTALWRLSEDATPVRAMMQQCRREAEAA
ncbi:hypothetical protein AB1285_16745 [Microbacterium sp. NRRL B-14842]|uniref:hypothetical protein n=1 Tax=Microbacterium sp. NRRL B-14842 TaxID=3162881 RepID=UPI0035143EF6